ncbi:diguanylate cyclase [Pelomonas sp. KK5]|uniref:GGDEF domain-containing protein n=1 Tax=Pelomonas sp. KK5 TaxID=1855730 RepID=UPI001301DE56|nr:diguanylate cyclase [Pelomonas sp. KK5]
MNTAFALLLAAAVVLLAAAWRRVITARRELAQAHANLESARADAEQQHRLLENAIDALQVGVEIYDAEDRLVLANRRVRDWFPAQHFDGPDRFAELLETSRRNGTLPLEAQADPDTWMQERLAQRGKLERPLLQQWADGRATLLHERRTPEGHLVCTRQDVSELIAKERALQSSQAQLQAIIGTAGVAILTLDEAGLIASANAATERMLGYAPEELLGRDVGLLMDEATRALLRADMQAWLEAGDRELLGRQRELGVLHQGGRELTVQLALAEVRNNGVRVFVAVLTDITERKRFEVDLQHANEQLLRLSTTDALTELANRRLLMNRLEDEWRRALRSSEPLALLLIDVDFFKLYNDHYGHPAGDACLQKVAEVLRQSANRPSDLAARYGGEEFVLLLPHTDAGGAMAVATRVQQLLREAAIQHELSPQGPDVTLSMGLVSGQANSLGSAASWLAQADLALYQAKSHGRNRIVQAPTF